MVKVLVVELRFDVLRCTLSTVGRVHTTTARHVTTCSHRVTHTRIDPITQHPQQSVSFLHHDIAHAIGIETKPMNKVSCPSEAELGPAKGLLLQDHSVQQDTRDNA